MTAEDAPPPWGTMMLLVGVLLLLVISNFIGVYPAN